MSERLMERNPDAAQRAFYDDLIGVVNAHGDEVSHVDLLALSSYLVGQLIACQDEAELSREEIIELINRNVAQGNQQAVFNDRYGEGGRA